MAKHPVPKKKVSNAKTAMRYGAFALKKYKAIGNAVNLVKCQSCGAPALNHRACPSCGSYRGRSRGDMNKTVDKITKVKA